MANEKAWIEARVQVTRRHAAQVESLLESQGALSIVLTGLADTPVLEPGVGETPLWPDVMVSGLFDSHASMDQLAAVLSLAPGVNSGRQISFVTVRDRDWERAGLAELKPLKFGNGLWIVPGGQPVPDPGATVMRLDPGLAFGSGTHPTTRLCLEWIDARAMEDRTVIDYGCGSGVLGIAAALKGAASVLCIDNDPQALVATRDNARRNGVLDRIEALSAVQPRAGTADVILANILAGTLTGLAPELCTALKPGGRIALSGILQEQADEVSRAYERWLDQIKLEAREEWVLISGRLREPGK
jgi:ribosomal protein L11 methyltransferase